MSLYIIEDRYGALRDSSVNYNYAKSLQQRKYPDGHIVEMVPAKPKVQVSQEEADMLKKAKNTTVWRPASVIAGYAYEHEQQGDDEVLLEDRLMRAYVNGYTVAKEKKYVVYKNLGGKHNTDIQYAQAFSMLKHTELRLIPKRSHGLLLHGFLMPTIPMGHLFSSPNQRLSIMVCKTARKKR